MARIHSQTGGRRPTPSRQRIWLFKRVSAAAERGMTITELADRASVAVGRAVPVELIGRRMVELERRGLLVDSGRMRQDGAGQWQRVYVLPRHELSYLQAGERRRPSGEAVEETQDWVR